MATDEVTGDESGEGGGAGGSVLLPREPTNQPTNQRVALIGSLLEHMLLETWCNCAVNGK